MFKKRSLVFLLLALMLTLVACGKGEENKAPADGANATSDSEQYYNAALSAEPTTLDPQKGDDSYGRTIVDNVYEPLLRAHETEDGKVVMENAGAESYEVSEDGLTYTFHIRDFNWEDGQAVTAGDYEYGIKRSADPNTGSGSAFLLEPILNFVDVNSGKLPLDELGVKAIDDKTLEIKLTAPAEYFIKLVPYRVMYPQRQDLVEAKGEQFGSEAEGIVGCGPYKVENWVHNSEINIVKSDTYWDKDNVKLSKVHYKITGDLNTSGNAFDVGEIDSISTSRKEWTDRFDEKEGTNWKPYVRPTLDYIPLNTKDKLLSNEKIRQAIQVGLDREALNTQVNNGVNTTCTGWVPPTINLGETPYVDQRGSEPLTELIASIKDPKALFIEGLKELGMDPDPSKITLNFKVSNTADLKGQNEFIQANLKEKLGVNVEIETLEWPILSNAIKKGDYQLGYLAWSADYDDPYAMMSLFLTGSDIINTGWSSPEYDALVKEASQTTDLKEAAKKYGEAEKMLIDASSVVPIANVTHHKFRYDYLKGLPYSEFDTTGVKYVYTEGRK